MDSESSQNDRPGRRLVIVGTGGQGVLTVARLLCDVFVEQGHSVVSGQLHGMAQRGGSVQSSVMIDCGISPVIGAGRANIVLGFEPVETVRALPFMSTETVVFMNTSPVVPYILGQRFVLNEGKADYPKVSELVDAVGAVTLLTSSFDATQLAVEAGSGRTLNTVMLGCLIGSGSLPCTADEFWNTAARRMPPAFREINTRAFLSGVEVGERFRSCETTT